MFIYLQAGAGLYIVFIYLNAGAGLYRVFIHLIFTWGAEGGGGGYTVWLDR